MYMLYKNVIINSVLINDILIILATNKKFYRELITLII